MKYFFQIARQGALLIAVMGVLLMASSVQAAEPQCCVKFREFPTGKQALSCGILTETPCNTQIIEHQVCDGRVLDNRYCLDQSSNPIPFRIEKEYEEQVNCVRYTTQCSAALNNLEECDGVSEQTCLATIRCFYASGKCLSKFDSTICNDLPKLLCGTSIGSRATACQWNEASEICLSAVSNELANRYTDYGGILPTCAYLGTCRSVNDIVLSGIRIGQQIFLYIGSFAFAFFIYGGITMILSLGSAEKVTKGKEIIIAAVVGLIISFGAYLFIDFILDVLSVEETLRGISI